MPEKYKQQNAKRRSDQAQSSNHNTAGFNYDYTWPVDSDCKQHMTGNGQLLTNYKRDRTKIQIADNQLITASGMGQLSVRFHLPNHTSRKETLNVLHVPSLGKKNLLSVKQMVHRSKTDNVQ